MMMMVIVLGWKISKSKVVVLEEGGVCNQGERGRGCRLGRGRGRSGHGSFSQVMCGMGWEGG